MYGRAVGRAHSSTPPTAEQLGRSCSLPSKPGNLVPTSLALKCGTMKCETKSCAAICDTKYAVGERFYFPPVTTKYGAEPTAENTGLRSDPPASADLPRGMSPGSCL